MGRKWFDEQHKLVPDTYAQQSTKRVAKAAEAIRHWAAKHQLQPHMLPLVAWELRSDCPLWRMKLSRDEQAKALEAVRQVSVSEPIPQ